MRQWLFVLLALGAVPLVSVAADDVVASGDIRLSDVWRFSAGTRPRRTVPDISEVEREHDQRGVRPDLCGMRVAMRERNEAGEVVEWNLLFSLVGDSGSTVGGLSANTFTIRPDARPAPRRAPAQLTLTIDAGIGLQTRPVPAPPGRDGVVMPMDAAFVEQVWNALDSGTPIRLDWTDDLGAVHSLHLRTSGTQRSRWYHGKNSPGHRCAALLAADARPGRATREVEHPW